MSDHVTYHKLDVSSDPANDLYLHLKIIAMRATQYVLCMLMIDNLYHTGQLCTGQSRNTWPAVGTVDGRGYEGQQNTAIYDAHALGLTGQFEAH